MRKLYLTSFLTLGIVILTAHPIMAYEKEIKEIASAMSESIVKAGKKSIAVVDFTDLQGNVTELGRFIAEEFSVSLAGAGNGFEIVDRTHLKSIAQEHKLSAMGIIDPKTARELGKITGVEALLTGVITPFEDSIRLSIKILETETAKIIYGSAANIPRTKAISELMGRGIEVSGLEVSSGAPLTSTKATSTPSPEPKTLTEVQVKVKDFIFETKECKVSGQKVTCYISVINNDQQIRNIGIIISNPENSIMVDDLGNQYTPVGAWFGAQKSDRSRSSYMSNIWYDVTPNLPMNLVLIYEEVSSAAKHANIVVDFKIRGINEYDSPFKAVLRNIPLTHLGEASTMILKQHRDTSEWH